MQFHANMQEDRPPAKRAADLHFHLSGRQTS